MPRRALKYIGIWLAAVLAAALLANFAGGIVVDHLFGDQFMPSLIGYSKKMQFPLKAPADEAEEKENCSIIMMRTLIGDEGGGLSPGLLYHFIDVPIKS